MPARPWVAWRPGASADYFGGFVAAPFTTLHPLIAAGWVAGLVQAWVQEADGFGSGRTAHQRHERKGFWLNPVSRILLVVIFANLGATLGVFISGSMIAAKVF